MNRSALAVVAAFAGGVLATGSLAWWLRESAPSAPPPAPPALVAPTPQPPPADDPFEIPKEHMPELMKKLDEIRGEKPPEEEKDEPLPPPTAVHYTKAEKYANEHLSDVPHDLVGAWDDTGEEKTRGGHRAFVLVVEPGLTDAQLTALAHDIWTLHQDADRLDVRIYDREDAATDSRVADDGKYANKHLVAQVKRHRPLKVDVIRVRGRVVGP